jgi:hypothetical protein
LNDIDVMRKAIADARKLVINPVRGEHIASGPNDGWKDGGQYWYNGGNRETAIIEIATALYTQRMKSISAGQTGDWLPDRSKADPLQESFEAMLTKMAEERANSLLESELGLEAYTQFMKTGSVSVEAKNGHIYTLSRAGGDLEDLAVVVSYKRRGRFFRTSLRSLVGLLKKEDYSFADSVVTLVKWLKTDPDVVDDTIRDHCGDIHIKGGEITE